MRAAATDIERRVVAGYASVLFVTSIAPILVGLHFNIWISIVLAVVVGVFAYRALSSMLPPALAGLWRRAPLACCGWLLLGTAAAAALLGMTAFMIDPRWRIGSAEPWSTFITRHSCLTAYVEGTRLGFEHVKNIYVETLYVPAPRHWRTLAGFNVDAYLYPPAFLILPAVVRMLGGADFLRERALWYGLDLACLVGSATALARWIGGREGLRVGMLFPALLLAIPVRVALQIGNFQIPALAMAMLAMIAFEKQKRYAGAALLSFACVAKLWPAVLLVFLLAQKRFREVLLTLAFAAMYNALALVLFGSGVFSAFVRFHLPRLASGAAFPMLKGPWVIAVNESVFGMVMKGQLVGIGGADFRAASIVAWIYTFLLVGFAFHVGRTCRRERLLSAVAWMALLVLASFRAPLLPENYGFVGPLWLLTLIAGSSGAERRRTAFLLAAAWVALNVDWPAEAFRVGVGWSLLVTVVTQGVAIALVIHAIRIVRSPPALIRNLT